ncbi:hypothetical protein [uncultured Methanomethylovorans sp.]|uniref:DUF7714 family protein n=1 Tax=uncultured Methanomethylovorans sp. TaxID=183759 RepID=UPI00260D0BC9|nr:hypothetical protein [uncultured Methanomethylovorans sp.]
MIFPEEYKYVGVTRIHPDDAHKEPVYFLSRYLILEQLTDIGNEYAIYRVEHTGEELLRKVTKVELIASGEQVIKYDKELNIKDRRLLIEKAAELCEANVNTVIFTGLDKHVTFVHDPDISEMIDLEIVDVVPPEPSWLSLMVRRLEASGIFGDLSIRFKENMKDLRQFEGERTVFPCSSSGLEGKCLDSDIITEDGSLLVGCDISRKLFESRFPGLKYDFINICPFHSDIYTPQGPFVTRCCLSERSGLATINGVRGAVVHWGASEFQVALTIRELVQQIRKEKGESK